MQPISQFASNSRQIALCESIVLTHPDRAVRAIQAEYCLASSADYVHVRWTMIVRVNHEAQSAESQDRQHDFILAHILSA
jgi:hypothetical protein